MQMFPMVFRGQLLVQALAKQHLFRWRDSDRELNTPLLSWIIQESPGWWFWDSPGRSLADGDCCGQPKKPALSTALQCKGNTKPCCHLLRGHQEWPRKGWHAPSWVSRGAAAVLAWKGFPKLASQSAPGCPCSHSLPGPGLPQWYPLGKPGSARPAGFPLHPASSKQNPQVKLIPEPTGRRIGAAWRHGAILALGCLRDIMTRHPYTHALRLSPSPTQRKHERGEK